MRIQLVKIKDIFFTQHRDLLEIMDKEDNKVRGYGYISCLVEGHNFAIPLRSSIRHKHGFMTSTPPNKKGFKGLDYTKAIIVDPIYLCDTFVISNNQFGRIHRNRENILVEFTEYINVYKTFILKGYLPEEYSDAYVFTTLINYHDELGLPSNIEKITQ